MKKIINCTTGEVTERELNAEELAQEAKDVKEVKAEKIAEAKKQSVIDEAKAAAQAKLEALGLTVEDLKALGL